MQLFPVFDINLNLINLIHFVYLVVKRWEVRISMRFSLLVNTKKNWEFEEL